jgi:nitroreductase
MSTPQHTVRPSAALLNQAATAALRAPSIFNTQPWTWQIHDGVADLRLDRQRQLAVVDPDARLATISCGAALHHFRAALAATGAVVEVTRLPAARDPDLLATARIIGSGPATTAAVRHYEALLIRHTDRRPFSRTPVPPETLDALRAVVEAAGAHLHLIRPEQLTALIVAADHAAAIETADPAYRAELSAWTHRPETAGDGVPEDAAVAPVRRRVSIRDFALGGTARFAAGTDDDSGTSYAVLFVTGDDRHSWLLAGEALGALLVSAVEHGVAASPMSDLVEVALTRQRLRRILAGIGEPMMVLRIGVTESETGVPTAPRRTPEDAIESRKPGATS